MGTDFGPPPQKGAKIGGPRYRTTHPNKTNAAFKIQARNRFKANVFTLRFKTLRYNNHACLPHDCYCPDHKKADRPVLLPTARLSPSYPYVITPRIRTRTHISLLLTFLHRIPFFNILFRSLILYPLLRYLERRVLNRHGRITRHGGSNRQES